MQNSGTLGAMPLESILESIQKDRATGTLRLNGSQGEATLFFLFGHLFHATDANRQGEPVVYDALDWHDGDFTFDSKAKLPAEETIKVSTAELLANRAAGSAAAPPPETTEEEAAAKAAATEVLAEAEKSGIVPPAEAPTPAAPVEPQPRRFRRPEPRSGRLLWPHPRCRLWPHQRHLWHHPKLPRPRSPNLRRQSPMNLRPWLRHPNPRPLHPKQFRSPHRCRYPRPRQPARLRGDVAPTSAPEPVRPRPWSSTRYPRVTWSTRA